MPEPTRELVPTRELPATVDPGLIPTAPDPGAPVVALPALVLPVPAPEFALPPELALPEFMLPVPLPTFPVPAMLAPLPPETEPDPTEPEPLPPEPTFALPGALALPYAVETLLDVAAELVPAPPLVLAAAAPPLIEPVLAFVTVAVFCVDDRL